MFPTLRHLLMATLFSLLAVVSYTDKVPSTNDFGKPDTAIIVSQANIPTEAPTNTPMPSATIPTTPTPISTATPMTIDCASFKRCVPALAVHHSVCFDALALRLRPTVSALFVCLLAVLTLPCTRSPNQSHAQMLAFLSLVPLQ